MFGFRSNTSHSAALAGRDAARLAASKRAAAPGAICASKKPVAPGAVRAAKKAAVPRVPALAAAAVLAASAILGGCGAPGDAEGYHIEYLNRDGTALAEKSFAPRSEEGDTDGMVEEFLWELSSDNGDVDYQSAIPEEVDITEYAVDGTMLALHFDEDYLKMDVVEEVLCRAAIVRTMIQIPGVDCVSFYIGDAPLADADGEALGAMYADSFIENPGEQINSIKTADLTLYFANEAGDALVREVREDVHYSSNVSLEKLVMEQLLEGPREAGAKSAIPLGTKLVTVSVADGVCYVSLDAAFRNQDYKVNEAVVIYSIVDSLTELSSASRVQISVNGDTAGVYRDSFALSEMYERNLDLLVDGGGGSAESGESVEQVTETEM